MVILIQSGLMSQDFAFIVILWDVVLEDQVRIIARMSDDNG